MVHQLGNIPGCIWVKEYSKCKEINLINIYYNYNKYYTTIFIKSLLHNKL